ncbi:MAG: chromate efflux transporter [Pseudorhodoplanes sp.]|uniref:chromate efflux transporter n=1 Tax=Pseudorhodoplanes sp. TaxID=1934341 RepID=UPI003D09EB30
MTSIEQAAPASAAPSFPEFLRTYFKIGCLGFGGPAGQIALMHRVLVDEKKWIEEQRFLHALNFCMLLPGPEAQQLATYTGWLMHGVRGGIAAGILFVLPGAFVMLALSLIYALGQGVPLIEGALFGIKAAVLVIVVEALLRIGKRALKTNVLIAIAAAAFIGIFFLALPFPLIVIGAGLIGYLVARRAPHLLAIKTDGTYPPPVPGRWKQAATAIGIGLAAWWAPVALAALLLGADHVLVSVGTFFSKLATVSFGGAYALLAYMAQQAVEAKGWLTAAEMVDGLGLAETTPGPLILVTQFVGFLAGYRDAAPFSAVTAGVIAAAMTTWVTFSASMLWIFAGAPFVEQLRSNRMLTGALAAITAAVVGVILNLTVWFALHVLFGNVTEQRTGIFRWYAFDPLALDLKTAALAVIAALLAFRFHRGLVEIVAIMAALGIAVRMVS